jgi:DNA-directed RNA polymerase specialized sigma24 family protein
MNSEHLAVETPVVGLDRALEQHPPAWAFAALYEDRFAAMVRLAVLMLGDEHLAEEVVQDAFASLYLRWSQVEHPITYVRQSVVNKCRDVIRRRK